MPVVKQYRKEHRLTQEQFAQQLGFLCGTYRDWERGKAALSWKAWLRILQVCPSPALWDVEM